MLPEVYSHLKLKVLEQEFQYVLFEDEISFLSNIATLKENRIEYFSFSFQNEFSLITPSSVDVLNFAKIQKGWTAIRTVGEMPFGTVQGLIANISSVLFKESIGVCVVSSFLLDVFFVRSTNVPRALTSLKNSGWTIIE